MEEVAPTTLESVFPEAKPKDTKQCYQSYKTAFSTHVTISNLEKQQKTKRGT